MFFETYLILQLQHRALLRQMEALLAQARELREQQRAQETVDRGHFYPVPDVRPDVSVTATDATIHAHRPMNAKDL